MRVGAGHFVPMAVDVCSPALVVSDPDDAGNGFREVVEEGFTFVSLGEITPYAARTTGLAW